MKLSTTSRSVSLVARTIFCCTLIAFFFTANLLAQQLPGSWKVYESSKYSWANFSSTISMSRVISSIATDNNGNAYMCAPNGSIVKFDGTNGSIYLSNIPYIDEYGLGFTFDRFRNCFWVRSSYGIVRIEQNGNTTLYDSSQVNLDYSNMGDFSSCIVIDSSGNVWCPNNSNSFSRFNGSNWQTVSSPIAVKSMTVAPNGDIWCTSAMNGVAKYNSSTWTIYNTSNSTIPHNEYGIVRCAPNGDVWFASNFLIMASLVKFNGTSWQNITPPTGVAYSFLVDKIEFSGNDVWLSDMGNGLIKYNGTSCAIYTTFNSNSPSISTYNLYKPLAYGIKAMPNGHLYMFIENVFCDFDPNGTDYVSPPSGLTISISGNSATLSWQPSSTSDVTYSIMKDVDIYDGINLYSRHSSIRQSEINSTSYIDHNFSSDSTCHYAVYAVKNNITSKSSYLSDINKPIEPSNLIVEQINSNIKLKWNRSSTPNVKYAVFKRDMYNWYGSNLQDAIAYNLTDSTYIDTSTNNQVGQSYYYRIFAYIDNRFSWATTEAGIEFSQTAPTISLSLVNETESKGYQINWPSSTTAGLMYNIYRRTDSTNDDMMIYQIGANSTGYTDTAYFNDRTKLDKEYYYYLKPQLNTTEYNTKSNEVFTYDIKDLLTITVSNDASSAALPLGEKIVYTVTVRDSYLTLLNNASIFISSDLGPLPTIPLNMNTNELGQVTYYTSIPRTGSIPENFIRNFTAKKWPYKTATYNTTLPINSLAEVWDIGFRPNRDGFSFDNSNAEGILWNPDCSLQPYENSSFKELYFNQSTQEQIPCSLYPDWNLWESVFSGYCVQNGSFVPLAVNDWKVFRSNIWPGECYGMSIGALLRYVGLGNITASGNSYDINIATSSNTREWLGRYQQYQAGQKQVDYKMDILAKYNNNQMTTTNVVDTLIKGMVNGQSDYRCIGLISRDLSYLNHFVHMMVPYRIERTIGMDKIYVYDPNHVGDTAEHNHDNLLLITRLNGADYITYNTSSTIPGYSGALLDPNIVLVPTFGIGQYTSTPELYGYYTSGGGNGGGSGGSWKISSQSFDLNNTDISLSLRPNPASDFLDISFNSFDNNLAQISVSNMLGVNILSESLGITKNSQINHKVNLRGIASGMYICRLSLGDKIYSSTFIVH